jgi:hypothetical protein
MKMIVFSGYGALEYEGKKQIPAGILWGDTWKEFGPAANDMMLEWHNVHCYNP